MNKLCKDYINEIKAIFPVKGNEERKYIKELSKDIEDYCEESNATTKEELYENYGNPVEVVAEYFSATGVPYVIKKLKISKYIKALVSIIIAILISLSTLYANILWEEHQAIMRQEVVIVEEVIE